MDLSPLKGYGYLREGRGDGLGKGKYKQPWLAANWKGLSSKLARLEISGCIRVQTEHALTKLLF